MTTPFRALVATDQGGSPASFVERTVEEIDPGGILIEVAWSSLNYKDALAVTGRAPIARRFPIVCGIDLAGTVVESTEPDWPIGERVLVTGCGLGSEHDGGYARFARVDRDCCVKLPKGLDARQAMMIGTAGFTAMLSLIALERNGASPEALEGDSVLVTGATGGVGSIAVILLSSLGYRVVASTGRVEFSSYLQGLGAAEVIDRNEISDRPQRPLMRERFGAAVDVVGGDTLAHVVAATRTNGTVAACGLAGGTGLESSVYPFILRGVTLAGINSDRPRSEERITAWERLSSELPMEVVEGISTSISLTEVPHFAKLLLAGELNGRAIVDVSGPRTGL